MSNPLPYALFLLVIAIAGGVGFVVTENAPRPEAAAQHSKSKSAITTIFWVGEPASAENDFIANDASYWDELWEEHFGGLDDPDCRNGFHPCDIVLKQNPFYVALPYGEFDDEGKLKPESEPFLPLKNRWVKITHGEKTCYGQWEDVGPNNENDLEYVFGEALTPQNTFGLKAGLDVSPALATCLSLTGNDVTEWSFIDAAKVPNGPWKEIVTN